MIDTRNGFTKLLPAYDLLSTRLVIPEKDNPEEMVLTLNGRKRNFSKQDFLKLNKKQLKNSLRKFKKHFNK